MSWSMFGETFANPMMMRKAALGGMTVPLPEFPATTAAAVSFFQLERSIHGIVTEPMVATFAEAECVSAPNPAEASVETYPAPPRRRPRMGVQDIDLLLDDPGLGEHEPDEREGERGEHHGLLEGLSETGSGQREEANPAEGAEREEPDDHRLPDAALKTTAQTTMTAR